jgi:predicted NBD/HSP70 family sugar kinase
VLKAQIKSRPAMKKISAVVARQGKNISQQKLTIGLDLGDRNSWYCVVNEVGQIQLEQRVPTNEKGSREIFGAMPQPNRARNRDAFALGQSLAQRVGA